MSEQVKYYLWDPNYYLYLAIIFNIDLELIILIVSNKVEM